MTTSRRVAFRLNPLTEGMLTKLSARMGMTVSEVCRLAIQLLFDQAPTSWDVPDDLKGSLARINLNVERIGVNLNQIARAANTHGVTADHLAQAMTQLQALQRVYESEVTACQSQRAQG